MSGLVVLLAGAALAIALPGTAPGAAALPATASFTAEDFSWHVTGDVASSSVAIAPGGTVTFGYPSGASMHNADFSGGPAPSSCTQTAGTPGGTPPPLPTSPTAAGWSGTCTFDTPGTYAFHCDLHPFMHGTIVVGEPSPPPTGTSTGTPPPPTGTAPPSSTGTAPPPAGPVSPGAGPHGAPLPRLRVSVRHAQAGPVLRGAVTAEAAGWRIGVTAFASNRALRGHRSRRPRLVRIGTARVRSTGAGRTPFALRLDAAARRALRRHRLAVRLRIVVTLPGGETLAETVGVVVRERRARRPAGR